MRPKGVGVLHEQEAGALVRRCVDNLASRGCEAIRPLVEPDAVGGLSRKPNAQTARCSTGTEGSWSVFGTPAGAAERSSDARPARIVNLELKLKKTVKVWVSSRLTSRNVGGKTVKRRIKVRE